MTMQVERNARITGMRIMPNELDTRLVFPWIGTITTVASQWSTKRFTPNGVWDVDPNVGSTATPGLSELAAFYTYYRVVSYTYRVRLQNLEVFPVHFYVVNQNTDPGTVGNTYLALSSNAFGKKGLLPSTSTARGGLCRGHIRVSNLVGTPAVEYEDNFRGLSASANPVDLIWFAIGVDSGPTNLLTANGVVAQVEIEMMIRFYDRTRQTF